MGALLAVAIIGLLVGVWLGLPGRYTQTPEEIEKLMESGVAGRPRKVKRAFTPLAWVQRKVNSSGRGGGGRRPKGFKLEPPEDRRKRESGE